MTRAKFGKLCKICEMCNTEFIPSTRHPHQRFCKNGCGRKNELYVQKMYSLVHADDLRKNSRYWRRRRFSTPPNKIRGPYKRKVEIPFDIGSLEVL